MSPETPVVFALGATGPAGVCLLRELAFRNYHAVIYARNPAKIPKDLAENALFQASIQGARARLGAQKYETI